MGGRSLLEWNLRWLLSAEIDAIWVNLHYRAEEVRSAVEAMTLPAGVVRFSTEDPILGTAGAWRNLAAEWDEASLVVYGDNVTRFDIAAFRAAHAAADPAVLATVALFDPSCHANTGIAGSHVTVDGAGRVTGFQEVRGGHAGPMLVSTGACILEPAVVHRIRTRFADFGMDVYPALVRDRALAAHVIETGGFCLGLDTPTHFATGRALVESGAVVPE